MAIAANDSLIVNKEGAPIDARTVAPTLEALAEIENPYVGLRVFDRDRQGISCYGN